MRIPRPPPPPAAFSATGRPISSASAAASSAPFTAPSEPGMVGAPACSAAARALALSPISAMCSGFGPT